MKKCYGLIYEPVTTIYESASEVKLQRDLSGGCLPKAYVSAISDEVQHGMGLRVMGGEEEGFVPVQTFYGYRGYCRISDLWMLTEEEMKTWENSDLMVTDGFCVDVLSLPMAQGVCLISLFRGSIVDVVSFEAGEAGWAKVRLCDGRTAYMRNQYLRKKEFSQAGLWAETLPQKKIVDEEEFRLGVIATARQYLGIQYRWGGRSTAGIDCSGLTSASYMLHGILIYRDARIEEGYPVHEICRDEMLPGDLMYFPGHIALYMGNGTYIHSTGKIGSGGVVINSLNPADEGYRADLAESLYAAGSIFFSGGGLL